MKHAIPFIATVCLLAAFAVIASGAPRSGKWHTLQQKFLRAYPECAACGTRENLNVHHEKDFAHNPSLELVWSNLITLCRKHHLELGHDPDGPDGPAIPDWHKINPNVRADAERMRQKLQPGRKP